MKDPAVEGARERRLSMGRSDLGLDDFDNGGVFHGAEVTELVAFAGNDLPHDAAHDL